MKVLSLDIAKTTGWSMWEDGILKGSGTIVLKTQPKDSASRAEYIDLLRDKLFEKVQEIIKFWDPTIVIMESTLIKMFSFSAFSVLQALQSTVALAITAMNRNIEKVFITPHKWKNYYGIVGGEKGKEQSLLAINKMVDKEITDHNISDSMLMYKFWEKNNV